MTAIARHQILAFLLASGGYGMRWQLCLQTSPHLKHSVTAVLEYKYLSTDELTPACIAANYNRDQPLSHAAACFARATRILEYGKRACPYAAGDGCDGVYGAS